MSKKKAAKKPVRTEKVKEQPQAAKAERTETERRTLAQLRQEVKATWPEAKNLSDAKREELVDLVERGDKEMFEQYQRQWGQRAAARRKAWLEGDSESAKAARAKLS